MSDGPSNRKIRIRGLRVHNIRDLDLDLPLGKLLVVTGVSGSGKSSLAFDTLFAEGQRRYIETFSAYTRQFLERIDRPDADTIENIPPAIAIRQRTSARNSRSTVGSLTEINDYLRLLYAKVGKVVCEGCGQEIRSDSPASVEQHLRGLPGGTEYLVAFPVKLPRSVKFSDVAEVLRSDGFVRFFDGRQIGSLYESAPPSLSGETIWVVVDRLRAGTGRRERVLDSIETAFHKGQERCVLLWPQELGAEILPGMAKAPERHGAYGLTRFSRHWRCDACDRDYPEPEPRLYNYNNPLGACPTCRGFGDTIDIDMDLVIPDPSKSIAQGAIAPWNTPAYEHELQELIELAQDYRLPLDVPYARLSQRHKRIIEQGVPERNFGGLRGFFRWLESKKYKMHIRVFLSRWRGYRTCPDCHGTRLKSVVLATKLGGLDIAQVSAKQVSQALDFFKQLSLDDSRRLLAATMLEQIVNRLRYLQAVGLDYLTLDRPLRTLSGGEAQRVALTKALGSGLVNTLYVLDEPSIGLHERDSHRLIEILQRLRDARNTVVVVEHDESIIRAADELVDMGPGAGASGGRLVYQGAISDLNGGVQSATADFLRGRRTIPVPERRRQPKGSIHIRGACANNLKDIDVEIPLGLLCVVTGVSGSGKSSLVEETLYPGLCRELGKTGSRAAACRRIEGAQRIQDCMLVDQSPIGRSSRSNPVTYIKAFDEIRRTFAGTTEARIRNFGPSHFSFNVDGGRCPACEGQGVQTIDMQFLADINVVCGECNGTRFRREILEAKYRGKNIAEVLDMSVQEAFAFFRAKSRIQQSLEPLIAVGLDYLKLGQPSNTLSGGEAQRLKLAAQVASTHHPKTLLILDEPTTGLHRSDISRLIQSFHALLDAGHSLVVVEHNMDVVKSADWIIDLGPEAADQGGSVVGSGTPEQIASIPDSITGTYLRRALGEP